MKLTDLIAHLQSIQSQIGTGGKHHGISGDVELMCEDQEYGIADIEPLALFGCGCWIGARIIVKKTQKADECLST